jgi:serine/threonine protein phosphatase PrpC
MDDPVEQQPAECTFELALLSDVGTDRPDNEDFCGHFIESPVSAIFAVADGVGGYEGGEIASRMAIETTLAAYRDSPPAWGAAKRLQRAVQQANIEIHSRALSVPELRRMATTLTAAVIDRGALTIGHVGDCRLYLLRHGKVNQMTKDHTWVGERVRMGLMTSAQARAHPERSALNRSVGRELIVAVDRISMALKQGDRLILCSDGLYNVLDEAELERITQEGSAEEVCRELIEKANSRGTADNLTVAFLKMIGPTPNVAPEASSGIVARLMGLFRRRQ